MPTPHGRPPRPSGAWKPHPASGTTRTRVSNHGEHGEHGGDADEPDADSDNVIAIDSERYDIAEGAYEGGLPPVDEGLAELRSRFASTPPSEETLDDPTDRGSSSRHPTDGEALVELVLFAADSITCRGAIAQATRIANGLGARASLQIVDLADAPDAPEAEREGIRFTPTLVIRTRDHVTRIVGSIDDATLLRALPVGLGDALRAG